MNSSDRNVVTILFISFVLTLVTFSCPFMQYVTSPSPITMSFYLPPPSPSLSFSLSLSLSISPPLHLVLHEYGSVCFLSLILSYFIIQYSTKTNIGRGSEAVFQTDRSWTTGSGERLHRWLYPFALLIPYTGRRVVLWINHRFYIAFQSYKSCLIRLRWWEIHNLYFLHCYRPVHG